MEENKEEKATKNTTPKKTTTKKKTQSKKNTTTKKATNKVEETKKETTKKVEPKKDNTSKSNTKKISKGNPKSQKTKPVEKKVEVEVEETKNKDLEKTIIFDGRQSKNIADVVNKLEEENIILDDKIVKRSPVRKNAIIILIILIALVIASTTYYVATNYLEKQNQLKTLDSNIYQKVSKKYDSASDIDNTDVSQNDETKYPNINSITLAQFEEKSLSKEDMVVLVASETCYASMSFEPLLDEVFEEYGITLYKVNVSRYTKEQEQIFRTYFAYNSTPTLFTIKAGIVTSVSVGKLNEEDLRAWIEENVK